MSGSASAKAASWRDRSLAEGAADDVEVDAALEALDDPQVDLGDVGRQLLGLHDAARCRLHHRVSLLRSTKLSSCQPSRDVNCRLSLTVHDAAYDAYLHCCLQANRRQRNGQQG